MFLQEAVCVYLGCSMCSDLFPDPILPLPSEPGDIFCNSPVISCLFCTELCANDYHSRWF